MITIMIEHLYSALSMWIQFKCALHHSTGDLTRLLMSENNNTDNDD